MKARLLGSLILGAFAAAIVTGYSSHYRHATLAHSSALNHQSVGFTLFWGFIGFTLIAAIIVFVFATVLASRPRRRQDAARRAFRGRQAPQRRPRADVWR